MLICMMKKCQRWDLDESWQRLPFFLRGTTVGVCKFMILKVSPPENLGWTRWIWRQWLPSQKWVQNVLWRALFYLETKMPESQLCCIDTWQTGVLSKNAKEPPMSIFLGKFSIVNWGSFSFLKSGDINNKRPQCLTSPWSLLVARLLSQWWCGLYAIIFFTADPVKFLHQHSDTWTRSKLVEFAKVPSFPKTNETRGNS